MNLDKIRDKIATVSSEVCNEHVGDLMHEIVRCAFACMISRKHMILYGPPGVNKSRVTLSVLNRIEGANVFHLPGSAFAQKEDLVGPLSMKMLDEDRYFRNTTRRIPEAHLGMLDETYEIGDALVKELHPIMNERTFVNDGQVYNIPLISVFGATNVSPEDAWEGKKAFIDRFLVRFMVTEITDPNQIREIRKLRREPASKERPTTVTLEEIQAASTAAKSVKVSDEIDDVILKIYKKLTIGESAVKLSTRRLVEVDDVLKASAWMHGRSGVDNADLNILRYVFWNVTNDIENVRAVVAAEAKSSQAIADDQVSYVSGEYARWKNMPASNPARGKAIEHVKERSKKIADLLHATHEQKKDTAHIRVAYNKISEMLRDMLGGKSSGK
jgi:MoxR-like ATPase